MTQIVKEPRTELPASQTVCPTCERVVLRAYIRVVHGAGTLIRGGVFDGMRGPKTWCVFCEGDSNRESIDRIAQAVRATHAAETPDDERHAEHHLRAMGHPDVDAFLRKVGESRRATEPRARVKRDDW